MDDPDRSAAGATDLGHARIHVGISVAISAKPNGPFVDTSRAPMVCQIHGSIDPSPFIDPPTGHAYLVWKSDDNSVGTRRRAEIAP